MMHYLLMGIINTGLAQEPGRRRYVCERASPACGPTRQPAQLSGHHHGLTWMLNWRPESTLSLVWLLIPTQPQAAGTSGQRDTEGDQRNPTTGDVCSFTNMRFISPLN